MEFYGLSQPILPAACLSGLTDQGVRLLLTSYQAIGPMGLDGPHKARACTPLKHLESLGTG